MKKLLFSMVLIAGISAAQAQLFEFTLSPAAEAAGGGKAGGTGTGQGFLFLSGNTLTFSNFTFSGLSGSLTAAHFHGPAPTTANTGVLYSILPLTTNVGQSSGSFEGSITLSDSPNGTTYTLAEQLTQLNSGLWYINLHTSPNFGGGEIRGQVLLAAVPEPAMLPLAALGLCGLWLWRRRSAA